MSKKSKPSSSGEQQPASPRQKNQQDVQDPRTKNSRHKKVTADKWNQ
jgi:hypothetical protein